MITIESHSICSMKSLAIAYSSLKPNVVRSPETTTISGPNSLISVIARSSRFGRKNCVPQWRSEIWAIVNWPSGIAGSLRPGQKIHLTG